MRCLFNDQGATRSMLAGKDPEKFMEKFEVHNITCRKTIECSEYYLEHTTNNLITVLQDLL